MDDKYYIPPHAENIKQSVKQHSTKSDSNLKQYNLWIPIGNSCKKIYI